MVIPTRSIYKGESIKFHKENNEQKQKGHTHWHIPLYDIRNRKNERDALLCKFGVEE